ncbi:PP2C family protein-serine/threonine phosphatase [Hymenobacter sp. BRD67]|uniref:PP2C family protein-serine/threonine phosphatase n=1 Tax=Hymenobacter sp. BRD67 TaxID=2675877 RepID=UPI001565538D|nr:PP2C family protein-serine/threonine phosphatase [Hymenobacter sp. BRD67]QKG53684.1 SpoIIE family protein phosphatase [Hymenobacter sp. BRD67]
MPKFRSSVWLIVVAALCWLLLLLGTLSQGHTLLGLPPDWPRWLLLLAQGGFAASVFLYTRLQPDPLSGHGFLALLLRLFWRGLILTALLVGVQAFVRLAADKALPLRGDITASVGYTISLALFIILLARTLYIWRSLVNFRGSPRLQREWTAFEVILGVALLFQLFEWHTPDYIRVAVITGLGLFGVYLSGHQRWVAYLSQGQKLQAIMLQLGVLGFLTLFLLYLRNAQADPALLTPPTQQAFLILASFFAVFYAVAGLLVTLFNLPIADVYEQRRAEILSLQQLSQIIQRGQTAAEIYQALFTSAVQTIRADAAWLDTPAQPIETTGPAPAAPTHELLPADLVALRPQLAALLAAGQTEIIDNDLLRSQRLVGLSQQYGSIAILPLRSSTHDYGHLLLLKKNQAGFEPEDLSILHTFTTQTVLSLENLQLAQEARISQRAQDELRIAALVQERLIPKHLPTDNWFEISTYAQAAKEVGGDFYDFLHLPGQRLAVLIGDVSGKGVTAAFHTAQMKGIFHALMQPNPLAKKDRERYPDPHRFMVLANEALTHCLERSSFITASFYLIDYEAGGFSFARAGHCHTLYYHSIKEEVSYFRSEGLGLGILRDASYGRHVKNQFWDYNPGDVMVIYTDGIPEARNADGDEYGEERLAQMLGQCFYQSAEEINQYIREDVQEFSKGLPLHDDQTLLVIKFKSAQPQP